MTIDLTTKALPDTVVVDGKAFLIKTDFRVWLKFERDLKANLETQTDFDVSYLFVDEMPPYIDISILKEFEQPPRDLPRPIGTDRDYIPLDFDVDGGRIYSAFMQQYGINLLHTDMHWYEFLALLENISDETLLGKVMGYRAYRKDTGNRKVDVREQLRRAWEIKPPISAEEQAEIDEFNSYFE